MAYPVIFITVAIVFVLSVSLATCDDAPQGHTETGSKTPLEEQIKMMRQTMEIASKKYDELVKQNKKQEKLISQVKYCT